MTELPAPICTQLRRLAERLDDSVDVGDDDELLRLQCAGLMRLAAEQLDDWDAMAQRIEQSLGSLA